MSKEQKPEEVLRGEKYKPLQNLLLICEAMEEYASLQNAELQIKQRELLDVLQEAALQIDYLHRKFKPTGSGKNVIARIESLIEKYTDKK